MAKPVRISNDRTIITNIVRMEVTFIVVLISFMF